MASVGEKGKVNASVSIISQNFKYNFRDKVTKKKKNAKNPF